MTSGVTVPPPVKTAWEVVLWLVEEALDPEFIVDATPVTHIQCSLLPWDGAIFRGQPLLTKEALAPKHPVLKPREQIVVGEVCRLWELQVTVVPCSGMFADGGPHGPNGRP